jgi:hypothetical protein
MAEIKEPEEAVKVIMDALQFLQDVKVKADVRPEPVKRDGNGKLTAEYTLKEWLQKINEELDEFKNEVWGACENDELPNDSIPIECRILIAEEACDVITVIYGLCDKFGLDGDSMADAMRYVTEKNRKRGYLDD